MFRILQLRCHAIRNDVTEIVDPIVMWIFIKENAVTLTLLFLFFYLAELLEEFFELTDHLGTQRFRLAVGAAHHHLAAGRQGAGGR